MSRNSRFKILLLFENVDIKIFGHIIYVTSISVYLSVLCLFCSLHSLLDWLMPSLIVCNLKKKKLEEEDYLG
jgi:hypothetical protein